MARILAASEEPAAARLATSAQLFNASEVLGVRSGKFGSFAIKNCSRWRAEGPVDFHLAGSSNTAGFVAGTGKAAMGDGSASFRKGSGLALMTLMAKVRVELIKAIVSRDKLSRLMVVFVG